MRSYGQYCGLAKALDVVGDRWTLLIVRELLLTGSARYTDLRDGLPGIATNLLADRLRALERAGLIERNEAPPPVATTVISLTPRGAELEAVIAALGRWASPLMRDVRARDEVRARWCVLPMRLYLRDRFPSKAPVSIQVLIDEEGIVVETIGDGAVRARLGVVEQPDATLDGGPAVVMGLLTGRLTLSQARGRGLSFRGDFSAVRRVQPRPEESTV